MREPLALRMLPPIVRQSVWCRFYRPTHARFLSLFDAAPLHFGPTVKMKLVPNDVISDSVALTGIYDLHFTKWLVKIARKEGGTLVDVGANLGYFSLLWCAQHPNNRAVAFEASPRNTALLHYNARSNALEDRIAVRDQAVGMRRGVMQFDLGPAEQTGWGGFAAEAAAGTIAVNVISLDEAVSSLSEITLLKIDIEGADSWALRGAERILQEGRVRHVWWEENKPRMRELGIPVGEAQAFMQRVGYEPIPQGDPTAEVVNWYARAASGNP
jgi:FkbM family methyltransferase